MLNVDVDNVVTLRKPRQVEGYVLDADSGQPIMKFKAAYGQATGSDRFYAGSGHTKEYSDPNGHFTLEIDDQLYNGVRVEAKDYAAQVQDVGTEARTSKVEFRLKPSASLEGIVVSQDGQPQPGVQVAITQSGNPGNHIRLRAGRLENFSDQSRIVITDANGAFTLDSPPETGGKVVAAGGSGFGSATVEEVRASGRVVLQDYGQIEGSLKIAGSPAPGQEFLFTMSSSGIDTDFNNFKVTTDADGRFKFTKLPAGEGEVVRLIRTMPNSWMHSHKTNVTVVAGQTTYISFGDSGALLKGTARLQVPWFEDEQLVMGGNLHNKIQPRVPSFSSPQESTAFFNSPEWQAQMRARQYYAVAVAADGSFSIDSVAPGQYTLDINASRPGNGPPMMSPVASGSLDVTVPDNPDPLTPIQIGEVVLLSKTNNVQRQQILNR
jgi:hypothetical protein